MTVTALTTKKSFNGTLSARFRLALSRIFIVLIRANRKKQLHISSVRLIPIAQWRFLRITFYYFHACQCLGKYENMYSVESLPITRGVGEAGRSSDIPLHSDHGAAGRRPKLAD